AAPAAVAARARGSQRSRRGGAATASAGGGSRLERFGGMAHYVPMPAPRHKWVYLFREGSAEMRDLLGGKGAGAAEMTRAGMPVPPGFTITTEACRAYYAHKAKLPQGLWAQVTSSIADLEKQSHKGFGDPRNPLLVSVRSGAKFSMPGMMDTVLSLGLNDD